MSVATRLVRVPTTGITLNVAEAGPEDGPLALLLHGFPEFWYGWRNQIGPLAEAGYRVVVPDQRGYNLSDKPAGVAPYALDTLVDDVLGLMDALGRERAAIVVGHDWGAIVGWWAITRAPGRFERAAFLNGPHPALILRELRESRAQKLKSWYAFAMQVPWLPEKFLGRDSGRFLARGLEKTSRPGTFTEADLAFYRDAWSRPGALKGMIAWYRAAFRHKPKMPDDPRITVPTQIIWGLKDAFINRSLARASYALCKTGRIEWIPEASHWVQHEEPGRVNGCLLRFLADPG
ncbi:alpha/beta fold hydrolase [Tundrisphaera sp. TA3]|uniref:alpha/beta fold hydrolase n=1 Tax=Tundrisphaera sp. TA3 TaxID=3435775 RepID=UPI003EC0ECBA